MRLSSALAAAMTGMCLAAHASVSLPQTQDPTQAAQQQSPAQNAQTPSPAQQAQPSGKVLFHRSIDENGQTSTETSSETGAGPGADAASGAKPAAMPLADDADRRAIAFTSLDLDVHLRTAERHIAVRALLAVRNDGKTPLTRIPLQVSSSLNWERIRAADRDAAFTLATLNSDTDHTGQLHEAEIALAAPLAPGATMRLDATYSGTISVDAKRLLAVGTPDDVAAHSDWDEIGDTFTGLRGFGNVVWYPVSSVPVIQGDGARVFDEIGEHKLRGMGARFQMRLAVEFPAGEAPTVAVINGRSVPLTVTDAARGQEVNGVATAKLENATLGFESPSLFVAVRAPHAATNATLWTLPEDARMVDAWAAAAADVTPFLEGWLGQTPRSQLTLLDLPDAHDAPFETGAMVAVPIRNGAPDDLKRVLVHALAHAFVGTSAQPAWLDEGIANFMSTLWTEKQQGREKALESLEAARPALALAEPESPGDSAGQPLARAISPVYYRTKAAYVFWMLRDIAGDPALSAALRGSLAETPAQTADAEKAASKNAGTSSFEKILEQAAAGHDLSWFFADWVDADKGLPDLSIESVYPTVANSDSWLAAVNVANNGYAAAEVPVTVRSDKTVVTQRILIPARGKASRRILIQGKPVEVRLNDGTVPETQASVHVTQLDDAQGNAAPAGQAGLSQQRGSFWARIPRSLKKGIEMPNMSTAPYAEFSYLIYLNWPPGANSVFGGFSEATGLTSAVHISSYRPGDVPVGHPIRLSGGYKVNDVTLKRGVVAAADLWNWITAARTGGAPAKSNATITLRNETGQPVQSWKLTNASPIHYNGPALGGKGTNDVAIESLILSLESIEIVPPR